MKFHNRIHVSLSSTLSRSIVFRRLFRTKAGRFVLTLPGAIAYLFTNKNSFIPPPHRTFCGRGDYTGIGRHFFNIFKSNVELRPGHKVLDIGCGMGRMAVPFTSFLKPEGEYHGFDIVPEGITWCRERIQKHHSNFVFRHVDVYNELYNKKGTIKPEELNFPYRDDYFDFIFLTSVFTHMSPPAIQRYLDEIHRVLKLDGHVIISMYLLNEESSGNIRDGKSRLLFKYPRDGIHLSIDPKLVDDDIAIEENWFRQNVRDRKFFEMKKIYYGTWSGRKGGLSTQDIVVIRKPAP
ncbi:class I SAM-dependent methyltransferase [Fibrobacterota bacterium]